MNVIFVIILILVSLFLLEKTIPSVAAKIFYRFFLKEKMETFKKSFLHFSLLFLTNLFFLYFNEQTKPIILKELNMLTFSLISFFGFYFLSIQEVTYTEGDKVKGLKKAVAYFQKWLIRGKFFWEIIFVFGIAYGFLLLAFLDIREIISLILRAKNIFLS